MPILNNKIAGEIYVFIFLGGEGGRMQVGFIILRVLVKADFRSTKHLAACEMNSKDMVVDVKIV